MLQSCDNLSFTVLGMSTVAEVITAHHCGMRVFAFSLITNECIMDYDSVEEANHKEVIEVGKLREPILKKFVTMLITRIPETMNGNKT